MLTVAHAPMLPSPVVPSQLVLEIIPLSMALPVMETAIMCVWAKHTLPQRWRRPQLLLRRRRRPLQLLSRRHVCLPCDGQGSHLWNLCLPWPATITWSRSCSPSPPSLPLDRLWSTTLLDICVLVYVRLVHMESCDSLILSCDPVKCFICHVLIGSFAYLCSSVSCKSIIHVYLSPLVWLVTLLCIVNVYFLLVSLMFLCQAMSGVCICSRLDCIKLHMGSSTRL